MERSPHLLRDYGLSLLLVLVAVLLFWTTMIPQIRRNRELDRQYRELLEQNRQREQENRHLLLLEQAHRDPLTRERLYRYYFGDRFPPPGQPDR